MSEPVVFEAWADFDYSKGILCDQAEDLHDDLPSYVSTKWDGGEIVRVRVTVEVIEPDDGPQEAA